MTGDTVVIAGLPVRDDRAELAGFEADAVDLTAQERRRARRRVVTRAGRVFTLMLPPGEVLAPRVALEVGRLHAALAVADERLLVPDEPALERLLDRLDVPWTRAHAPFLPITTGSPH